MPQWLHDRRPEAQGLARFWVALAAATLMWSLAVGPRSAAAAATSDVALQVSFKADDSVRLRGQRFSGSAGAGVAAVNEIIARNPTVRVQRVFQTSEKAIDARRARLLGRGRRNVPDLNRHYRIVADDAKQRDQVLAALQPLSVVDDAIAEPEPTPPPVTPSFISQQRYRGASPGGIDVAALGGHPGGRGEQVKIVDIEYAWNTAHEDLVKAAAPGALIANGTPHDPFPGLSADHGTAVLGELVGTDNAFGITGLAPGSEIAMVNAATSSPCNCWALPEAVSIAHENMQPGDVMLVEQQVQGLGASGDYVPAEFWPAAYDAITLASQDGIIVVEAAGNAATTGVDLDAPAYGSPFPQGKPDSGAIVVGAGSGDCSTPVNSRLSFSAYGSRVNLQGWGQCVTTTGYGALFNGSANSTYTQSFSGTSSAAPIVAAAAALYSSVHQASTGEPPTPQLVRRRLVATGTPQAAGSAGHIGPLPDLQTAAADFDPPAVTVLSGPSGPTNDSTPTFEFTASEPGATLECLVAGATAFTECGSPFTTAPLPDGGHTLQIRAANEASITGPVASRAFTVDTVAPAVTIGGGASGPTSDPTPTFTFSASEPGVSFACRAGAVLQPGSFAACTSPYTTAALADGEARLEVRATDAAANTGPVASRSFTVTTAVVDPPERPAETATTAAAPPPQIALGSSDQVSPPPFAPSSDEPPKIGPGGRQAVRVGADGSVRLAQPTVSCPDIAPICAVTASARRVEVRSSRPSSAVTSSPIGATKFTVQPGKTATIRFGLTRTARALLKRRGSLEATVAITARHGSSEATRTVRVALKLKRRR